MSIIKVPKILIPKDNIDLKKFSNVTKREILIKISRFYFNLNDRIFYTIL